MGPLLKHVLDSREKEKSIFSMQLILKGKGEAESIPLCIDVDGTLLKPDLLFESFLQLIKQKPWLLPCVPVWLIQGRAYLKQQLAKHASVLGTQLPMHPGLLDFLTSENENGRLLVLCSGSDQVLVNKVAAQLALPVEVMASDGVVNLKGAQKAQALVDRFGLRGLTTLEMRKMTFRSGTKHGMPLWSMPRLMIALCAIALPIVLKLPIGPHNIGLAVIVSLTLVYLVLFGNSRYHFPMMPWVAMYSGMGAQVLLLGKSSLRLSERGKLPLGMT